MQHVTSSGRALAVYVCRCRAKNAEEENSVVELYLQCCADTVQDRALLDMVEQVCVCERGEEGLMCCCWW
jgi:hypothetical protein